MTSTLPTLRGIEHLSMTVPDLDEATGFFTDMFGCQSMYTMGPFSAVTGGAKGSFMRTYANADVRAVVQNVRVLRSPFLNVELFAATYPGQRTRWPDRFDIGGWELSAYVDDIDAAIEYATSRDVVVLGDGKAALPASEAADGAFACQLMTPWGLHFEIRSDPSRGSWTVRDSTYLPRGGLPTFRGFERISLTVPDLDEASRLFVELLGADLAYDLEPPVDVGATPTKCRVLDREGLNLKVVECPQSPEQNRLWPGMLDIGGWHLAFYVDDVDAALEHLASLDLWVLGGKKPAFNYEAGDEAYTVHCLTPFGFYFELVTYPTGRYRAAEFAVPAWHPIARHPTA